MLYWTVLFLLLAASFALRLFGILPIQSSTVFGLGLLELWNAASTMLGIDCPLWKPASPRLKRFGNPVMIAMGLVWMGLALTPLANQPLPMLAASVPFILALYLLFWLDRRKS